MTSPKCPNCRMALEKMPSRKMRCKACGNFIYIKSTPRNRTKRLMTEAQAADAEAQWQAHGERARITGDMRALGLAPCLDAVVSRAAMARLALDPSSVDSHQRKMAATMLSSPRHSSDMESRERWALLAATEELERLRRHGAQAEILAGPTPCPSCRALRGAIWQIDDALRRMPLPNTRCELFLRGGGCCAFWASPMPQGNKKI